MRRLDWACAAALLLVAPLAGRAAENPGPILTAQAAASPAQLAPGGRFSLKISCTVMPGYHVNAHIPSEDYLIPTQVKLGNLSGISISNIRYPEPVQKKFAFSEKPLAVYEGTFVVAADGAVDRAAANGTQGIAGTIEYQACNDKNCLAPASAPFQAEIAVGTSAAAPSPAAVSAPPGQPASRGNIASLIAGRGIALALLIIFGFGLTLNLTPCVFPVIPITVAFFGGQSEKRTGRPIALAAFYVLGICVTYSALGVFAALAGKLFGSAMQSPWVLGGIAAVLAALALSMFGLYDLQPPRFLMNRAGARTGRGGAFAMGLLMGVVAAPCLGPFVSGLLLYVAERRDPVLGFSLFFVLSLGLGFPYLFLAAFSGAIARLPRAGEWMVDIKRAFGFILLAMAAYFVQLLPLPPLLKAWLLPGVAAVGGFYLMIAAVSSRAPALARVITVAAGGGLLAAALLLRPAAAGQEARALPFSPYTAAAVQSGNPVLIDFSADWCIPCHELDDKTFADPRVRKALEGRVLLKADMTRQNTPEAQALARQYGILGMPTIVFLDASGKEIDGARLVGFEGPDPFLERLSRLRR